MVAEAQLRGETDAGFMMLSERLCPEIERAKANPVEARLALILGDKMPGTKKSVYSVPTFRRVCDY